MMKRFIALVLVAILFSGCGFPGAQMKDAVTFYYQRTPSANNIYDDYFSEGVIGSEMREFTGHREDLNYLLTVYFKGPLDPAFSSPFPLGTRVLEIQQENDAMTLVLNPFLANQTDLDISIACACMAMTCMDLTGADTVTVESRNLDDKVLFSRTFTRDNLFLQDNYTQPVESTANSQ